MRKAAHIVFFSLLLSAYSCSEKKKDVDHSHHSDEVYYTCPMHPSVISKTPGACPVCGMQLVMKEKKKVSHKESSANTLHIDTVQQRLANIKTQPVGQGTIGNDDILLGTVTIDERNIAVVTTRVSGRIEKLYVKTKGEFVKKGQLLYQIYSEDLAAEQAEYIALYKKLLAMPEKPEALASLLTASRDKLLLWGMSDEQIRSLEKALTPTKMVSYYSSQSGSVDEILAREGEYLDAGGALLRIIDLSRIWVEAQVYPTQAHYLKTNLEPEIEFEGIDGIYKGQPVFDNPSLEPNKRINLVRYAVNNTDGKLRPGMMAYIKLSTSGNARLVIPNKAVLPEKMPTVWVKIGKEEFERRMIETGIQNQRDVEVISGLNPNEQVVISGAYLLNSEFILKQGAGQKHSH